MEQPTNVHDDAQHRNALIITINSRSVATKQKKKKMKKYYFRKAEEKITKDRYSVFYELLSFLLAHSIRLKCA